MVSERTSMRCQILCLSGGGFRGLFAAEALAGLEEAAGVGLAQCFDLIAGTSIGGILALALAAGVPARRIADTFREQGATVFSRPRRGGLSAAVDLIRFAGRARHRPEPLARLVAELVGDATKIGDLRRRVMIPAVNLTKGRPQVFKTPHHPTFVRDGRLRLVDVALATSAAPTYFPLHPIGDELFADGGLYANAPDLLALHEAEHFLRQPADDVVVLSIGTTTAQFSLAHATGRDLGWLGWMRGQRLAQAIIGAQQINATAIMQHRLGARYMRIDMTQSPEQAASLGLDVATTAAARTLGGLAEAALRDHLGQPALGDILAHRAPAPRFF
jgi:patatin-like phospholipase/acyl hydrolase